MMIGKHKDKVINNIKEAVKNRDFNCKVEVDDPTPSAEELSEKLNRYMKRHLKITYKLCNLCARGIIDMAAKILQYKTTIEGIEHISDLQGGAIVTSNHFHPLDNLIVRQAMRRVGNKRLFIVSQDTNLFMKGLAGFLMNYADIIPISDSRQYMNGYFSSRIANILEKNQWILIYPEQEMWYQYRKPRPPKRGAYYYAARNNVPIISCFVELQTVPEKETDMFYKTRYVMHVLKPIYPDAERSRRENSIYMMETDYRQKAEAYEQAYGKRLTYVFENWDIAGLAAQGENNQF